MRNRIKQLNNQGSTLLTVIICIAFIAILGSMMLAVTMTNLQMKVVESKSKQNFYSAEVAMEEIRIGIQELTSESIRKIYEEKVLMNYATYLEMPDEVTRNKDIQEKVVVEIVKVLCETGTMSDTDILDDILNSTTGPQLRENYLKGYISDNAKTTISRPFVTLEPNPATNLYLLRISGVTVTYLDDDYQTKLSSDIVINMPSFSFNNTSSTAVENYKVEQPYKQFVLIADGKISTENTIGSTGVTNIQGNVYAGPGGIEVYGNYTNDYQVNIIGDHANIITRGDITVNDTAKLTIGPISEGKLPLVWATNLVTRTNGTYPPGSTITTDLVIKGINLIKDDLTIEGRYSNVDLLGGAYIGYTGAHTAKGSSIIVNGSGSNLDLSGLSRLILAGRAHVSVGTTSGEKDILTGESIAFKSNQRAYLIPGGFMKDIKHNPITKEDYEFYGTPVVEIPSGLTDGIVYNDYLGSPKFNIASKITGTAPNLTTLRYYYFNFGSGSQADAYMRKFYDTKRDALNFMAPFTLHEITLSNPSVTSVVGNQMKYSASNEVELVPGMSADTITYPDDLTLDTAIANLALSETIFPADSLKDKKVGALSSLYSRMTHNLYLNNVSAFNEADEVVKTGIKSEGINNIFTAMSDLTAPLQLSEANRSNPNFQFVTSDGDINITSCDSSKQYLYIVKGNVNIAIPSGSELKGIIYATGDITIGTGVKIKGMLVSTGEGKTITVGNGAAVEGRLIARGDIKVGQGCTLTATETTDSDLDGIFAAEGNILRHLYNNADKTISFEITNPASSYVDLSDIIVYEKWQRIE